MMFKNVLVELTAGRGTCVAMFKNVLIGVDGSQNGRGAIACHSEDPSASRS